MTGSRLTGPQGDGEAGERRIGVAQEKVGVREWADSQGESTLLREEFERWYRSRFPESGVLAESALKSAEPPDQRIVAKTKNF